MKIKDLIAKEIDIDCYDNVVEDIGIAFCGPMVLTDEGMKEFGDVIEYTAEIIEDPIGYDVCIIIVDDDPDVSWKDKVKRAKRFFYAIAGYCADTDYQRWFKDPDEEE